MGSCDYEAVSALVDGELDEQECDGVIRHLNECRECCRLFERFHATRTLVRGEGEIATPRDLSDRVSAAIAEEAPRAPDNGGAPAQTVSRGRFGWGWMATAAGIAGVAVAAGFLMNQVPTPNNSGSSPSLAQPAEPAPETRTPQATESEDMATIQRYLPEHSSFVPNGAGAEFQRTRLGTEKRR
ncbi:sigma-E factor negative regulatory protein [Thiohalorhabdus sp.]|uniref:sigma-E factor negative regulatory protein n=1 Tax=Thiohalorhabdus sp. TaxID=3094134 RepID=UPI002FC3150E